MTIRVIELFAGIGAQAQALKELGLDYEVVATSDIDMSANKGYEAIHGAVNNLGDITKIEHLPPCDLLTYSWPCQAVSVAGKQNGMVEGSGTTSSLLWEVGRLLKDLRERGELPEVLVAENVDAVLNDRNISEFKRWIATLKKLGYTSSYTIMNAKDYGTPQNRRRMFMVSTLNLGMFKFPTPEPDNRVLSDILEEDVPESYYLSEKRMESFSRIETAHSEDGLHLAGDLNDPSLIDLTNRVYMVDGVSPTIATRPGYQPKIIIEGMLGKTTTQHNTVYGGGGIAPTLAACDYRDPIKIVIEGENNGRK